MPEQPGPILCGRQPREPLGKDERSVSPGGSAAVSTTIKFTTGRKDGSQCPRPGQGVAGGGCCECHTLRGAYAIIDEPGSHRAARAGTDTGRLTEASAKHAALGAWLGRAEAYDYEPILDELASRFGCVTAGNRGNSALRYLSRAKVFFAIPPDRLRESRLELLRAPIEIN